MPRMCFAVHTKAAGSRRDIPFNLKVSSLSSKPFAMQDSWAQARYAANARIFQHEISVPRQLLQAQESRSTCSDSSHGRSWVGDVSDRVVRGAKWLWRARVPAESHMTEDLSDFPWLHPPHRLPQTPVFPADRSLAATSGCRLLAAA